MFKNRHEYITPPEARVGVPNRCPWCSSHVQYRRSDHSILCANLLCWYTTGRTTSWEDAWGAHDAVCNSELVPLEGYASWEPLDEDVDYEQQ